MLRHATSRGYSPSLAATIVGLLIGAVTLVIINRRPGWSLAAGILALAVVAWWLLRISKRLPIARFFGLSSLLIAVLAVVLVGKGVAALQEAGWIAQNFVDAPRVDWIGVYPTWQSLLAQLAVAGLAWTAFSANARAWRMPQRANEPRQLQRTAGPIPPRQPDRPRGGLR